MHACEYIYIYIYEGVCVSAYAFLFLSIRHFGMEFRCGFLQYHFGLGPRQIVKLVLGNDLPWCPCFDHLPKIQEHWLSWISHF